MNTVPDFDLIEAPLTPGVTLLEASAGTGKTYTLAGIYLRLIIERDFTPSQILVSTYTVAATAELRDRIRRLLRSALETCQSGTSPDAFLRELFSRASTPAAIAQKRLEEALRSFDEAAIFTIHGFCQRTLQDRAFESGTLFDAELVTDQQPILREVADDYWRLHFHGGESDLVAFALLEGLTPARLAALLKATSPHPSLRVLPGSGGLHAARTELLAIMAQFRVSWPAWREEMRRAVVTENEWAKGPYAKADDIALLLDSIETCCSAGTSVPLEAYAAFARFTPELLEENTRARGGHKAPQHEFFALCAALSAARRRLCVSIEADFLAWARAELPRRKAQQNVLSFDDLLVKLHAALHGPAGDALTQQIRSRYRAALIDEFQDTDALQDAIFRRLFADGASLLYLIGDPKQAIYGFRGADVFAYLRASVGAERFKLGTNFRSTTALVGAINHLFARPSNPFLLEAIDFSPVHAAGKSDALAVTNHGEANAPFRLWRWKDDKKITSSRAHAELPHIVASEIARMLTGSQRLDGRPLEPSDFAVLVASNRQAQLIQNALCTREIPSVLLSSASVFTADEAGELQTVLAAISEPSRAGLIRTALTASLFNFSAIELESLSATEHAWESWLLRFQRHHQTWRSLGFIQMFRQLLQQENARARLLQQSGGERRLTNFLHLAELLHRAACEQRLDPSALVNWLAEQRSGRGIGHEDFELRLERDEAAVRVVTIHKSKGLEYNIVFCPFSWGKAEPKGALLFHDKEDGALTLDLGSEETAEHEQIARCENLAEQLRLLYVALTRAKLETHFAWGRFNGCEVSAANWLLHGQSADDGDPVGALLSRMKSLTDDAWQHELATLGLDAPDSIAVVDLPGRDGPQYRFAGEPDVSLKARAFCGAIERDWRITSFTALTAGHEAEQPDFDRGEAPARPETAATGIHAFARGMKAGVCLHEVFEELDFQNDAAVEELVGRKLASFGFEAPESRTAVAATVRRTLSAPLAPGLTLRQIARAARLDELEFFFPFGPLQADELGAILGTASIPILPMHFERQRGFIKGFIDLIFQHDGRFYIVDWKSNWLGSDADAYNSENLRAEMTRHHYGLQYHLYVLALHRYLALRLPEYDYARDFGGVFYLFIRGLEAAERGHGIFHDRPRLELIESLDALFSQEEAR